MVKSTAGATVDADAPLLEAGIDSLGEIELKNQLSSTAGVELPSALLETFPTARQLAAALKTAPKAELESCSTPVVTTGAAIDAETSEASPAIANSATVLLPTKKDRRATPSQSGRESTVS